MFGGKSHGLHGASCTILPSDTIISKKLLFRFIEKVMYLINNIDLIHYFFNESKKYFLLIIVSGGSIE
jgi:hypothetical protein